MRRKTFVKQLMAIGIPRNEANSICRRGLEYTAKQRAYGLSINITWEYNLGDMCEQFDRMPTQEWLLEKWGYETVCKYRQWLTKRSKEDPRRSWSRNHPNGY